jgi:hypothetical protein
MIIPDNAKTAYTPWKVIRDGKIATEHKHHAWADQEIKDNGGDELRYINSRGFWVTIWKKPVADTEPEPAYR